MNDESATDWSFLEAHCLRIDPFFPDDTDRTKLSDRFVKTRTAHACTICFETIDVGARARALREKNNTDNIVATFYFCPLCCKAMAVSMEDDGKALTERTGIGMRKADAI